MGGKLIFFTFSFIIANDRTNYTTRSLAYKEMPRISCTKN